MTIMNKALLAIPFVLAASIATGQERKINLPALGSLLVWKGAVAEVQASLMKTTDKTNPTLLSFKSLPELKLHHLHKLNARLCVLVGLYGITGEKLHKQYDQLTQKTTSK